jgi:sugar phosphate permease
VERLLTTSSKLQRAQRAALLPLALRETANIRASLSTFDGGYCAAHSLATMQISKERSAGLRRRWTRILPAVLVTYSLAYLERANYALGAAAGLAATLHITQARSALLAAAFFLGYFIFQVPGTAYAQRTSSKGLIFWALIAWGILAGLTGVIHNFGLLLADRLLLGVAESVILPTMIILLANWFTKAERSRANALCILGNPLTLLWMSAITGYLINAVGWQRAFVIEGIPSIVWAFGWLTLVDDRPAKARWLNPEDRTVLTEELTREQAVIPQIPNFGRALRSRSVVMLSVTYFLWSLGLYGFVLWLPTIVREGSSQGMGLTGLLSAVPYLAAALLMMLVSHLADKTLERRRFIWPFLLLSGVAFFLSFATANKQFAVAYGFLILAGAAMYAPYGPYFALISDLLPANVAGESIAFINSCGALGGFAGTYFVGLLRGYTGNSRAGILTMAAFLVLSALTMMLVPATHAETTPKNTRQLQAE